MKVILSHTIRIYPNKTQDVLFRKSCGCARVAYNYGLAEYKKLLDAKQKTNIFEIKKKFNQEKKTLFPWMYDVGKDANQQPFTNLQNAFNRFFKKTSKFPTFKKKGRKDSFYISNDQFSMKENKFRLPKVGWVRGAEKLRFSGKIISAVINRKSNYWFISIKVETEVNPPTRENQAVVGVDIGIKTLATLSDGKVINSISPLRKRLDRLKVLQRRVSRKVKGSSNRRKANHRVAKLHYEVACLRKDVLNKLTTYLCENYQVICIEDLDVPSMIKNHNLALSILDMGFGEFKRQLAYKSILNGNTLIFADRWFPSSKLCSDCGSLKDSLSLSQRQYECESCGVVIDRDLNAAINLKKYGLKQLGVANPEVTPMDKNDVVGDNLFVLNELGTSKCSEMIT
jgi:putative transposase